MFGFRKIGVLGRRGFGFRDGLGFYGVQERRVGDLGFSSVGFRGYNRVCRAYGSD